MKVNFLLSFLFLIISNSWGQDTLYSKGNSIVVSKPESVSISDPVTGDIINKIVPGRFTFLNGEKIYSRHELDSPPIIEDSHGNNIKLSEYIFQTVKDKLELLEDGMYILDIANPVIDKHGRLVYYEMKGIKQIIVPAVTSEKNAQQFNDRKRMVYTSFLTDDRNMPFKIRNDINNSVNRTLTQFPMLKSGRKGNSPVNTTGYLFSIENHILVEKNVAKIMDDFFSL